MNCWNWVEVVICSSVLVSVSLDSMGVERRAILAFSTLRGMFWCTISLSITTPSMIWESRVLSPTFFSTLTRSMSNFFLPL